MLPSEIQNKIFYMMAEHPLASIFKKHIDVKRTINENLQMFIKYENIVRIFHLIQYQNKADSDNIEDFVISEYEHRKKYNKETKYDKHSEYYNKYTFMSEIYCIIEDYNSRSGAK